MAKGPKAAAASAIARDPRMRNIPAGVPLTPSSAPGAAVSYSGRARPARTAASMTRYSGTHNPLGRR